MPFEAFRENVPKTTNEAKNQSKVIQSQVENWEKREMI